MTKKQKIDFLYRKAKGEVTGFSKEVSAELSKYRVVKVGGKNASIVKKANIEEYIDAVDSGECKIPYVDWCLNNCKADRRFKNSSVKDIKKRNRMESSAMVVLGFFFWSWCMRSLLPVGTLISMALGGSIAFVLYRNNRFNYAFSCLFLPIIIVVIKEMLFGV